MAGRARAPAPQPWRHRLNSPLDRELSRHRPGGGCRRLPRCRQLVRTRPHREPAVSDGPTPSRIRLIRPNPMPPGRNGDGTMPTHGPEALHRYQRHAVGPGRLSRIAPVGADAALWPSDRRPDHAASHQTIRCEINPYRQELRLLPLLQGRSLLSIERTDSTRSATKAGLRNVVSTMGTGRLSATEIKRFVLLATRPMLRRANNRATRAKAEAV